MSFAFDLQLFYTSPSSAAAQTTAASQQAVTNALNILNQQKQQSIGQLQGYLAQNPMPFTGAQITMPTSNNPSTIGGGTVGGSGAIRGGTYGQ